MNGLAGSVTAMRFASGIIPPENRLKSARKCAKAVKPLILRRTESSRILGPDSPISRREIHDDRPPLLTPVREAHRFDERALDAYLAPHVEGYEGGLHVRQFEGGQSNPTFALRAGSREYVLRKQPPGELLPSAHQVDREYRVMHALRDSDVPVPKMYALCEDTSVIGTKFYVMEKVAGRVFTDLLLPSMNNDRAPRRLQGSRARARRAALASTTAPSASRASANPATTTRGRSRAGASSTWRRRPKPLPAMDKLMKWLPEHTPEPTKP